MPAKYIKHDVQENNRL